MSGNKVVLDKVLFVKRSFSSLLLPCHGRKSTSFVLALRSFRMQCTSWITAFGFSCSSVLLLTFRKEWQGNNANGKKELQKDKRNQLFKSFHPMPLVSHLQSTSSLLFFPMVKREMVNQQSRWFLYKRCAGWCLYSLQALACFYLCMYKALVCRKSDWLWSQRSYRNLVTFSHLKTPWWWKPGMGWDAEVLCRSGVLE